MSGIYTLSALNQSLSGIFGKKGQTKDIYPKTPIDFKQELEKQKSYTKEEKELNYLQEFNSWARLHDRK